MPTVCSQSTCFHGSVRDVINLGMWLMQQYHNFTPSLVTQGEKQHSCPRNCAVLKVHGTLTTACLSWGCHCSALVSLKDKKCLKEGLCFSLQEAGCGSEFAIRSTLAPSLQGWSQQRAASLCHDTCRAAGIGFCYSKELYNSQNM